MAMSFTPADFQQVNGIGQWDGFRWKVGDGISRRWGADEAGESHFRSIMNRLVAA